MSTRTLRFIVDGQSIIQDPNCDFDNIISGTIGYLKAEFNFSPDWDGFTKAAGFFSNMGTEYEPQILRDGRTCVIPPEACERSVFKVQVVGKKDDIKLVTDKVAVRQKG